MAFSSFNFIFIFMPVLLTAYFAAPASRRGARNAVLLVFGLVFYACGGLYALPVLLLSVLVNYALALKSAPGPGRMKCAAALAAVLNLGLLAAFKYAAPAAKGLASLGLGAGLPQLSLPLGLSFFTFRGIAYVLDVSRGTAEPERSLPGRRFFSPSSPSSSPGP